MGHGLLLGGRLGPGRLGHPGRRRHGHRAGAAGHPAHPGRPLPAVGPRLAGGLGRPALARPGHPGRRARRPARQLARVRARRGPGGAGRQARRGARDLRRADGRPALRVHRRALQRPAGARAHPADARAAAAPAGVVRRHARAGAAPAALARARRPLAGGLPRPTPAAPSRSRTRTSPPRPCARSSTASGRCAPMPACRWRATTWSSRATATGRSVGCARRCSSGPTPGATWWVESWWDLPDSPEGRRRDPVAGARPSELRGRDGVERGRHPTRRDRRGDPRRDPGRRRPAMVELRAVMFEAMGTASAAIADPAWRRAAHDWFADRAAATRRAHRGRRGRRAGGLRCGRRGHRAHPRPQRGQRLGRADLERRDPCTPGAAGAWPPPAPTTCCAGSQHDTDVAPGRPVRHPGGAPIYTARGFTRARVPGDVPAGAPLTGRLTASVDSREHAASPRGAACSLLSSG